MTKYYQPHEQRVIEEQQELSTKVQALATFIEGETYAKLDQSMRELMFQQLSVMRQYNEILLQRIQLF